MLGRFALIALVGLGGCSLLPQIAHQPSLRNPYPQLSKVAVAPFFNLSDEPTVDGREVAMAYYSELQSVQGYEVVPVGVVETAMRAQRLSLRGPDDARRLAQVLGVDAVVIGAVTDFTMYYPPRCGLQVEWYAANPGFHPIPAGYGLPWGQPEEEDIPSPLVYEAELALAKEQLQTQTPPITPMPPPAEQPAEKGAAGEQSSADAAENAPPGEAPPWKGDGSAQALSYQQPIAGPVPSEGPSVFDRAAGTAGTVAGAATALPAAALGAEGAAELPPNWPDPRGFIPPPPSASLPPSWPSAAPVMRHTRFYSGNDGDFTAALESYYLFRDEARFGGWQSYLQRKEDFVRFCCHMHLWEMLSARGGAGETRVVWYWSKIR